MTQVVKEVSRLQFSGVISKVALLSWSNPTNTDNEVIKQQKRLC